MLCALPYPIAGRMTAAYLNSQIALWGKLVFRLSTCPAGINPCATTSATWRLRSMVRSTTIVSSKKNLKRRGTFFQQTLTPKLSSKPIRNMEMNALNTSMACLLLRSGTTKKGVSLWREIALAKNLFTMLTTTQEIL